MFCKSYSNCLSFHCKQARQTRAGEIEWPFWRPVLLLSSNLFEKQQQQL